MSCTSSCSHVRAYRWSNHIVLFVPSQLVAEDFEKQGWRANHRIHTDYLFFKNQSYCRKVTILSSSVCISEKKKSDICAQSMHTPAVEMTCAIT